MLHAGVTGCEWFQVSNVDEAGEGTEAEELNLNEGDAEYVDAEEGYAEHDPAAEDSKIGHWGGEEICLADENDVEESNRRSCKRARINS